MSREILEAMNALAAEKGISADALMDALEDALLSAYRKQPGSAKYARVEIDRETADFRVYELLIPDDLEADLLIEHDIEEGSIDPETGEPVVLPDPELDWDKVDEFRDRIEEQDVTPSGFGRIAAMTAKQVILHRVREAERELVLDEFRDRVGELITGIVQQKDSRYTLVQLRDRVEALLPKGEQVWGESYQHNQRIKAVIKEVEASPKGPSIIVSRRDPELIRQLFALEVPEIADGLVEITDVAREPGYRAKIAVVSHADGVDPVGACVGPRGSRVRMVVSELRGEKIDIIPFNDEPARFVAKALSPARVREVLVDDENRQATVIVPDDQLALAIGREGQNARLAARLTGWRIDIRSETEFVENDDDTTEDGVEEHTGMCAAILGNGRRCPNDSLPGLRYCGLTAHQALSRVSTDLVAALAPLSIDEVEALANPELDESELGEPIAQVEAEAEELVAQFEAEAAAEAEAAEAAAAAAAEAEGDEADAAEDELTDVTGDETDAAEEVLEDVVVDEADAAEADADVDEDSSADEETAQ